LVSRYENVIDYQAKSVGKPFVVRKLVHHNFVYQQWAPGVYRFNGSGLCILVKDDKSAKTICLDQVCRNTCYTLYQVKDGFRKALAQIRESLGLSCRCVRILKDPPFSEGKLVPWGPKAPTKMYSESSFVKPFNVMSGQDATSINTGLKQVRAIVADGKGTLDDALVVGNALIQKVKEHATIRKTYSAFSASDGQDFGECGML
jgi:hypothetical protein